MIFPYENEAKSGAPMPDGLTAAEQMYYQSLALLSTRYRFGGISAEDSVREKKLLEQEFMNAKGKERYSMASVMLWRDVENAATAFAKDRSIENAEKMYEAIYGCVLKKQEAVGER